MSHYTEQPPEQAVNPENPQAPGVPNATHQVEIFDGTTSRGFATVGANGTFTHTMNVAVGSRSITAKALGGTQPVSEARTFTVAAAVTPAITSVKDPQNTEIPNGGTTVASSVTLTGTASANQQVEIFDAAISKGTVNVNANGTWQSLNIAVAEGAHNFTAKAKYGEEQASPTFSVNVLSAYGKIRAVEDFSSAPAGDIVGPINTGIVHIVSNGWISPTDYAHKSLATTNCAIDFLGDSSSFIGLTYVQLNPTAEYVVRFFDASGNLLLSSPITQGGFHLYRMPAGASCFKFSILNTRNTFVIIVAEIMLLDSAISVTSFRDSPPRIIRVGQPVLIGGFAFTNEHSNSSNEDIAVVESIRNYRSLSIKGGGIVGVRLNGAPARTFSFSCEKSYASLTFYSPQGAVVHQASSISGFTKIRMPNNELYARMTLSHSASSALHVDSFTAAGW